MMLYTYAAGGSTPAATYQDSNGAATNTNPIVADGNGLFPAIYLPLGSSFKFVCTHGVTNALPPNPVSNIGVIIWTQDGIPSVSSSAPSIDLTGTAGESLAMNAAVYLSDGSGGKTAGQFYNADSSNGYSSSLPVVVGIATSAIPALSTGLIRVEGSVTGFSGLTVMADYYIGTAGALTTTSPSNPRLIGVADTTTSLIIGTANLSASGGLDLLQIEAFI